jgi:hypothetical protein
LAIIATSSSNANNPDGMGSPGEFVIASVSEAIQWPLLDCRGSCGASQ